LIAFTAGFHNVAIGTELNPIVGATFSGGQGINVQAQPGEYNGAQSVYLQGGAVSSIAAGGSAIFLNPAHAGSGIGSAFIKTSGNTAISATPTGFGIAAATLGGNATIVTDANIGSSGNNVGTGVQATAGAGNVSVTLNGGSIFANNNGVNARSDTGSVSVIVNGGNFNIAPGGTAVNAVSNSGPVTVQVANGTAIVGGSSGEGIAAFSSGGNVTITTGGAVSGGLGIDSGAFGSANLIINATAGSVTGIVDTGILAATGSGFISITSGAVTGVGNGIEAYSSSGNVTVVSTGNVVGNGGTGILAGEGTTGNVSVTTGGTVSGSEGIVATAARTGNVTINATAGAVTGNGGDGIVATAAQGNVLVTSAAVTGAVNGINATTTTGDVSINQSGTLTAGSGNGVIASTTTGNINVTAAGTVTGGKAGINTDTGSGATAINVASGFVAGATAGISAMATSSGSIGISVGSAGTVQNISGVFSDLAIMTSTAGSATLSNAGAINGTISMGGGGTASISNNGIWNTAGSSNFGGGGTFNNSGAVNLLATGTSLTGFSTFNNLGSGTVNFGTGSGGSTVSATVGAATFNNAGTINLRGQTAGNALTINGNFVGQAGSHALANVSSQGGTADALIINGNASGSTVVNLTNLTPAAPFTTTPTVIQVRGTATPNAFTTGTVQGFGTTVPILLPQTVSGGQNYVVGFAPTAPALSSQVVLNAVQAIAFGASGVVFDRVTDLRDTGGQQQTNNPRNNRRSAYAEEDSAYAEEDDALGYAPKKSDPVGAYLKAKAAKQAAMAPSGPRQAVWLRSFGDYEQRSGLTTNFSIVNTPFATDLGYNQQIVGVLGGTDFVWRSLTNANDGLILGVLGGYNDSHVSLHASPATEVFTGGSFGVYGTYIAGPSFLDLLFKTDFLSLNINDVGLSQSANLTNYDFAANVGYKAEFSQKFYVEPTAGLEYVNTQFDHPTTLTATTIPLQDGFAWRMRAGARMGTEWITNNVRIEPSVGVFAYGISSAGNVALFTNGASLALPSDVGLVRGEVQAAVNFFDLNSGWSGFVRGDTRFGEGLWSAGGRAGIRYQW
jgi:outer membrane autotransporter protein